MTVQAYLRKMRGTTAISPPRVSWEEIFWSWLGGFVGIMAVMWVNQLFFTGSDLTLLFAPLGASAVLVYGAVRSPLAQPRNLVGGHIVSAISGVACYKLFHGLPWMAEATAVATAIAMMHITRTLHPPGGATALIAVIGSADIHKIGWLYVLVPAALGPLILLVVAVLINNIPATRHYPDVWLHEASKDGKDEAVKGKAQPRWFLWPLAAGLVALLIGLAWLKLSPALLSNMTAKVATPVSSTATIHKLPTVATVAIVTTTTPSPFKADVGATSPHIQLGSSVPLSHKPIPGISAPQPIATVPIIGSPPPTQAHVPAADTLQLALQIGIFKSAKYVRQFRARLARSGVATRVQNVASKHHRIVYRLLTAVYHNKHELEQTRSLLNRYHIRTVMVQ